MIPIKPPLQKLFRKFLRILPRRDVAKLLRGMQPFGGSGWWILNRTTVERVTCVSSGQ